jgi:hypothetical protein
MSGGFWLGDMGAASGLEVFRSTVFLLAAVICTRWKNVLMTCFEIHKGPHYGLTVNSF